MWLEDYEEQVSRAFNDCCEIDGIVVKFIEELYAFQPLVTRVWTWYGLANDKLWDFADELAVNRRKLKCG